MSIYYGKTNAIISSGSGGAELNLAYGLTPPSDTSKIWVRTDKTPTSVEITDNPTWSDEITTTIVKDNLTNIPDAKMVRAGEYIFFIGGQEQINGTWTWSNKIRKYNPLTDEFETLDFKLPYGITDCNCCVYKDCIYIFFGKTLNQGDSKYYFHPRLLKYNWKTNEIYNKTYSHGSLGIYNQLCMGDGSVCVVGDKALFVYGGAPYQSTDYPTTNVSLYKYNTGGGIVVPSVVASVFNLKTDEFEKTITQESPISKYSPAYQPNKSLMIVGGYWSSYTSSALVNLTEEHKVGGGKDFSYSYNGNPGGFAGQYNAILSTNKKVFICGGMQTISGGTPTLTTNIIEYDCENGSFATRTETMPSNKYWGMKCQYNEQTTYAYGGTNLCKIEDKILLNENELIIIPEAYGTDEYEISSLDKTTIKTVYIGNSSGYAEELRLYKYDSGKWIGINCDNYVAETKKNISIACNWIDATSTRGTSGIVCGVGDLIIASVIARDSGNESVSSGWTLLGRSQVGELNQTLAFYYKIATTEFETITITQSSSARIYISLVSFAGKTTATFGSWSFNANSNEGQITLPNKICLVSASSNLWTTVTPYNDYTYSGNDDVIKVWMPYEEVQCRLGTWIDDKGGERTITGTVSSPTTNTCIIGYVVIE